MIDIFQGALFREPSLKVPIQNSVIVNVYEDGGPYEIICLSRSEYDQYWRKYLRRLQAFWRMCIRFNGADPE